MCMVSLVLEEDNWVSFKNDEGQWQIALAFMARMVVYVTILVVVVIFVYLILQHLDCDDEATVRATETNRLLPNEAIASYTYGTCDEDLELGGKCSSNSASDDLYDGKICVICYDEQRNCFFIPCGHCATCYVCAQRIMDGEGKSCPVCRRFIHRVRKLFTS